MKQIDKTITGYYYCLAINKGQDMSIMLKKLDFRVFIKNGAELYRLLDTNRNNLTPWFWWAGDRKTSTKFRFCWFMILLLADAKRKEIAHKINSEHLYDEIFCVYNNKGQIGGICGLDDIDITKEKSAEFWGFAFKGNKETIESVKILENYCVETLGLKSIYAEVQSDNMPSRLFWKRYGYDNRSLARRVLTSNNRPKFTDIYTYTKYLSR